MKKIYTIFATIGIVASSVAQTNALFDFNQGSKLIPISSKSNLNTKKSTFRVADTGPISMRIDPIFNVFTNNNTPGTLGTGGSIGLYRSELFCDSLAQFKYTSGLSYIGTHMTGITFDPQSLSQGSTPFTALFSKLDSYIIDTLYFGGEYKRVSAPSVVDTLIIDVAWGDTTNTSVFAKYAFPSTSALGKFGSLITPKFSVASVTLPGVQAKLAAPTANYKRYKAPLNVSDTNYINNVSGYFNYKLPTPLNIPAGSRVAICYTYKPGMTYTLGSIASGDATNPATINGWNPTLYGQSPQPTSSAGYLDYFNDFNAGKNMGVVMYSNQRYGTIGSGFIQTSALYNQFAYAPLIDLYVRGISTVGVNELEKVGFTLGQNVPNPFTSGSAISYQLANDAKSVMFTVTDVMGRVVSSEKASSTIGTHTVNIGSFAAGVYYYSLNVDGKVITKKMIAQ
jgi:hypothetical protein